MSTNLDKPLSPTTLRAMGFKKSKGKWVLFASDKVRNGRGIDNVVITRDITMYDLILHLDERARIEGWDAAMRRTAQFAGDHKSRGSPIRL